MAMHVCMARATGHPLPAAGRRGAGRFISVVPPICGLFLSPKKIRNKHKAAPTEQLGQLQKCLEGSMARGCREGGQERSVSLLVGNGLKPLLFVFKETNGRGAWIFRRPLGP